MGVEYLHAIVVRDVNFTAVRPAVRNVHAVLEQWGLTVNAPECVSIENRKRRLLNEAVNEIPADVTNVVVEYSEPEPSGAIEEIFGPSFYSNIPATERYVQSIRIVAGADFKITRGDERYSVEIVDSARDGGLSIGTDKRLANAYSLNFGIGEVIPATAATIPPVTRMEPGRPDQRVFVDQHFSGIWRAGILFDCGKDLPAFIDHDFQLPNRLFVEEIAAAFGSEVCEYGIVY